MSESVHSDNSPKAALAVAERYAGAVNYLYPLLINVSQRTSCCANRAFSARGASLPALRPAAILLPKPGF